MTYRLPVRSPSLSVGCPHPANIDYLSNRSAFQEVFTLVFSKQKVLAVLARYYFTRFIFYYIYNFFLTRAILSRRAMLSHAVRSASLHRVHIQPISRSRPGGTDGAGRGGRKRAPTLRCGGFALRSVQVERGATGGRVDATGQGALGKEIGLYIS